MTTPTRTRVALIALSAGVAIVLAGLLVSSLWLSTIGAWVEIIAVAAWLVRERQAQR